jgi:hypothetical protein
MPPTATPTVPWGSMVLGPLNTMEGGAVLLACATVRNAQKVMDDA